jgi:hypothetical protein
VPGNIDAPIVAAPAATIPFVKNARRLVGRFILISDFFIGFSPFFLEKFNSNGSHQAFR